MLPLSQPDVADMMQQEGQDNQAFLSWVMEYYGQPVHDALRSRLDDNDDRNLPVLLDQVLVEMHVGYCNQSNADYRFNSE
jgi:hypothetical protein